MTDRNYFKLKAQVKANYHDNEILQLHLLHKIKYLELLDARNPGKLSIEQAYIILDKVSQKNFENLDADILELERIGEDDIREFSLVRTIMAIILLPIILPILLVQMLIALATAYQYMLLLQGVILATTIIVTLFCLNPLFLILTAPAAILFGHILSDLILGSMVDRMIMNLKAVVCSLFYTVDGDLDGGLREIKSLALQSRYVIEGNFIVRFFKQLFATPTRHADEIVEDSNPALSDAESDATTPGTAPAPATSGGYFGFLRFLSGSTTSADSEATAVPGPKML